MADNGLKLELKIANPEVIKKIEQLGEVFQQEAEKTFTGFIFEVHKYLLRVTPIDTGELRGGWTAYLDKNNIDYSRQLYDTSIAEKAPGRDYHLSDEGVQIGKGFSTFAVPTPLDVTIINSVPYAAFLEEGTSRVQGRHFTALTRYKAELQYEKIFTTWFKKMSAARDIVPSDTPEEISV